MAVLLVRRLLVPVSFSEHASEGVRAANDLAQEDTSVTLLHVLDPVLLGEAGASDLSPREKSIPLQVEKSLLGKLKDTREKWLPRVKTVKYEIEVSRFTAEAISEHAQKSRADLVVLTDGKRRGLLRFLVGSVVDEVVRKAPCPVLVMRADERG
jgi:nucleotide-binding universal stress UspA family protein